VSIEGDQARPPRRTRSSLQGSERIIFALAVVAVAGVLGTFGFGLAYAHLQSQVSNTAAARSAASEFLTVLTNWSPATIDGQFDRIETMATGTFQRQAVAVFAAPIRTKLKASAATTTGHLRYLFVQSFTGKAASVFGVVDQTYSNVASKGPHPDELHLVVDLAKVNGQWKVSSLLSLTGSAVPS
jgi:hypothetical protein